MSWLAAMLLRVGELGLWGVLLFVLLYVAAAVTLAPAFVLSVAAGALFGVWKGSVLVLVSATLGATAAYGVARMNKLKRPSANGQVPETDASRCPGKSN